MLCHEVLTERERDRKIMCKGKTCAGHYMMPDELFCVDASTSVASSPPSEVLKTLYDNDPNDLEGAARQVLLPTNEVRHIITVVTRNSQFC